MNIEARKNLRKLVGLNLKRLRKKHDFCQTKFGELLGVHQTALCRIEHGIQRLDADQFYILNQEFGAPMENFFWPRIPAARKTEMRTASATG